MNYCTCRHVRTSVICVFLLISEVEKDKKVLRQIVLKQCLEVLLDPLMEE